MLCVVLLISFWMCLCILLVVLLVKVIVRIWFGYVFWLCRSEVMWCVSMLVLLDFVFVMMSSVGLW